MSTIIKPVVNKTKKDEKPQKLMWRISSSNNGEYGSGELKNNRMPTAKQVITAVTKRLYQLSVSKKLEQKRQNAQTAKHNKKNEQTAENDYFF